MFSLVDAGGVLVAVLAAGVLVALPGVALARLFGGGPALPAAFAVLPVAASLGARLLGLDATLALDLVLAGAGVALLARDRALRPAPSAAGVALLTVWLGLLVVEWIDLDLAGRLFQPLTVFDTVKHAATTQAILDAGVPPRDAFFLRPERSSYYYYFYTLTALVARACWGHADAKAAVGGVIFWVGVGLVGLMRLVIQRAGIEPAAKGARRTLLIVAVLALGGFDIVANIVILAVRGHWMADPLQWNAQVSIWTESLFWIPHHVVALIASAVGLVALCDLADAPAGPFGGRKVLLSALAFASTVGLSVWVALALVASVGVWSIVLLVERRWRVLGVIAAAGALALLFAAPDLRDLLAGRHGPMPITVEIRTFAPVDALIADGPWRMAARALALPLNYLIEFGALAVGSALYWSRPRRIDGEFARVLIFAAATGLVLGALFRSLLYNNDLGWRVTLFPMLAASVWTFAALDDALDRRASGTPLRKAISAPLTACLLLSWATSLSTLVSMRIYPWLPVQPSARFIAADPQTERATRAAYEWANAHLPASAVLQHNPSRPRALAFGLYSRNPVAVSDAYGGLYGADLSAADARRAQLAPIFEAKRPVAEIKAIAARSRIDDLVVTAADPVWQDHSSFVWTMPPVYASERVRILPAAALGG